MSQPGESEFYTAEEAMKVLGLKKSKFYQGVEEGKIPFELPPGKRQRARYSYAAV